MCLPVCPTYALTAREESSPRGRIRLMREMYAGKLEMSDTFVDEMYFCLDCQACQTACPAGVQYGTLVEDTRKVISEKGREPFFLRIVKKILLNGILASRFRTKLVAAMLRFYRHSGLQKVIGAVGLPASLRARLDLLPPVAKRSFDASVGELVPHAGMKKGRVAFLTGCIMNVSFPEIHADVVDVLTRNGFDVVIPKQQVCCGSLHAHYGEVQGAMALARKNIEVFEKYEFDALIVDSAGCGAFIKEYGRHFENDPVYAQRARSLANKTKEIMEFLSEVGFERPSHGREQHVTYHEACHLVHTQKISGPPREIINSVPGAELKELPESTWCCGSAGIYNVVRFDDSMQLLDRKMNHIKSTNAEIVCTANPGCHIQLQYGIKRFGLNMDVVHPVSLLNRAYQRGHDTAAGPHKT